MKKKVILLSLALLIFLSGMVSAASLWGTYKGNPIIKLTVNGKEVRVTDVPAINYNDRTMIPIYLLKEAGINYTWNQSTRTVDIVSKNSTSITTTPSQPTKPVQPAPVLSTWELYSYDGKTYLGKLTTNKYDVDSVFNEYGLYGSKYSITSIWNEYGIYGSKYANTSAFNKLATEPPIVYEDGVAVGYISKNTTFAYTVDPNNLYAFLEKNGR